MLYDIQFHTYVYTSINTQLSVLFVIYCKIHVCIYLLLYTEPTCPNSFIFKSVPSGVTVSLRCFTLSSYLHGGSVTAKCGANGIWERMDISQCTFRTTTVDYIFILGNTENTIANPMDTQVIIQFILFIYIYIYCPHRH